MSWTTTLDLQSQAMRHWTRGDILRSLAGVQDIFPLKLTLRSPTANEITNQFDAARLWIAQFAELHDFRVEWCEVKHRVLGAQRLPESIWLDAPLAAIKALGKQREARCFQTMVSHTRETIPALLPWLYAKPIRAVAFSDRWPSLIKIVQWVVAHPLPNIFLRQADIVGVHSKFIEQNAAILGELLDLALPADAVVGECNRSTQFCARYGFKERPLRIRFRVLDGSIEVVRGSPLADVTLNADAFAALGFTGINVFITENETNFLSFPTVTNSIVVFGAGYGWEALRPATWLHSCSIYYWGDIDTHGFAILNQLRSSFPEAQSLLMNRETLLAHTTFWGTESEQVRHDLKILSLEECAIFNDLRDNVLGDRVRLEQEHVGFEWVAGAISRAVRAVV